MDFIVEDRKDLDFLQERYELNTFSTHRNNKDASLNSCGEQLIQLCIVSKLRILNGRTRGDLEGHFTYLGYQGCSTVDLVLASENIFQTNLIQCLSVQTFTIFSDHRPILLRILRKYPNDKYKELKIISKSLNRNLNIHFLRTKFYQLRKVYKSPCKKLKCRHDQQLIKKT